MSAVVFAGHLRCKRCDQSGAYLLEHFTPLGLCATCLGRFVAWREANPKPHGKRLRAFLRVGRPQKSAAGGQS